MAGRAQPGDAQVVDVGPILVVRPDPSGELNHEGESENKNCRIEIKLDQQPFLHTSSRVHEYIGPWPRSLESCLHKPVLLCFRSDRLHAVSEQRPERLGGGGGGSGPVRAARGARGGARLSHRRRHRVRSVRHRRPPHSRPLVHTHSHRCGHSFFVPIIRSKFRFLKSTGQDLRISCRRSWRCGTALFQGAAFLFRRQVCSDSM